MIKKIFTVSVVVMTIFWAVGLAAFVPTAQAATISSGDLIKASLPAVYYYGADGKRYVFPNETTYKTWYADFSMVKTITDGELAAITIGGNVTDRPGVKLVKITTDPKVYAVAANGTLRWLSTASIAASLYGANWGAMIVDVSDAFFVNYTIGAPINAVADYDPAAATAAAQSINVDKGLAGATTGGALNVSLASDTPASASVAAGASANMAKIMLAAGSAAVKVKQMYITRSGLSSNDDINNIKVINSIGATVGDVGSLGANSKALITFIPTLEIPANTSVTYFLRGSIGAGAPAGNTVALGVSAATDVVLEAGTVTGAFPVMGNYMSIVVLADLGGAEVGPQGAGVDSQPDAGDKRVLVSEFYVSSISVGGSSDNLTVESLSVIESGSANTSDSANIELYSLTESRTLGTVSAWDANSRATWGSLGIVIPKGGKHIFQVYVDVLGGSGNVIDVDATDGSDALVVVKGNTYGFYLTPAIFAGWDGQGMAGALGQTVGAGILNVSKSSTSPATGNITQASDQALTTWDFEVRGESAKVTQVLVTVTLGGGLLVGNLTNAKLVDEAGNVIGGPRALRNDTVGVTVAAGGCGFIGVCAVFTETNIVPTGTNKYTFKIDVLSSAIAAGTLRADITAPNTDIVATGLTTRDNVTISTAAANGNVQTVLAVALDVTTLTIPASRNVAAGSQDFVWAAASLSATNSGEDVRVSAVTLTDNFNDDGVALDKLANSNDLTNLEIWADLTSAASSRGDAYETKVSNTVQPANNPAALGAADVQATAVTLSQTITVAKGTYVNIAAIADLSSLADPVDDHTLNFTATNATGKTTGNLVTWPPSVIAGAGQLMTISGAGVLTATIDASSPVTQILVSGSDKQTVAVIKLAANNIENQDLDQVIVTDGGTGVVARNWYLYASKRDDGGSIADPVAIAAGAATANFQLADNTVIVPANGSVALTVKADVAPVDGVTVVNTDTLQVTTALAGDIQATGKSSGAIIPALAVVAGATHDAYASRPYFSLNAASPSGALVPSLVTLLAVFNVQADATDDITWDGTAAPIVGTDTMDIELSDGSACIGNLTLKDEGGTTLDVIGGADGVNTFVFATNDLVVSKGTTKKLYVYGDATGCTTSGDTLQVYFDETDTQNWSINYDGGGYDAGAIIFRGNLYGNALVKG